MGRLKNFLHTKNKEITVEYNCVQRAADYECIGAETHEKKIKKKKTALNMDG